MVAAIAEVRKKEKSKALASNRNSPQLDKSLGDNPVNGNIIVNDNLSHEPNKSQRNKSVNSSVLVENNVLLNNQENNTEETNPSHSPMRREDLLRNSLGQGSVVQDKERSVNFLF